MSILHTLITYRAMALSALYQDTPLWPEGTTFTDADIWCGPQSLTVLAAERGTPCVLIAPRGTRVEGDEHRTIVIATIRECVPRAGRGRPTELQIDCDLQALEARVLDSLLLKNPNAHHRKTCLLRSAGAQATLRARLPPSVRPGDLLALTCTGTIALAQMRLR